MRCGRRCGGEWTWSLLGRRLGLGWGGSVSCRQSRLLEQAFLLLLIPGKQIFLCWKEGGGRQASHGTRTRELRQRWTRACLIEHWPRFIHLRLKDCLVSLIYCLQKNECSLSEITYSQFFVTILASSLSLKQLTKATFGEKMSKIAKEGCLGGGRGNINIKKCWLDIFWSQGHAI